MTDIKALVKASGGALQEDNKTHTNRIEIRSESSNRLYIVAQARISGEWQCSCPGWVMKKAGKERGCKHLKAVMPLLAATTEQKRIG